jgi:hypothetical protein
MRHHHFFILLLLGLFFLPVSNAFAEEIDVLYMITQMNDGKSESIMLSGEQDFVGPRLKHLERKFIINGKTYQSDDILEIRFEVRTIDAIQTIDNENGIKKDDTVYNMNGQVVRRNARSLDGLPKGLYIMNGKKYIVR